jgi:hypothetical protein
LGVSDGYTFTRRPDALVHAESHERIDEAVAAERRIKGWSRANKKLTFTVISKRCRRYLAGARSLIGNAACFSILRDARSAASSG